MNRQRFQDTRPENPAFTAAREKGRKAGAEGKPKSACPYGDHRTHRGAITWSRAFQRAWVEGWRAGRAGS